jgi:hypothetical protein
MVIYDDDLSVQILQALSDGPETKLQKVWYPVIDDNDGEDHTTNVSELGSAQFGANYDFFSWNDKKLIYLHSSI